MKPMQLPLAAVLFTGAGVGMNAGSATVIPLKIDVPCTFQLFMCIRKQFYYRSKLPFQLSFQSPLIHKYSGGSKVGRSPPQNFFNFM